MNTAQPLPPPVRVMPTASRRPILHLAHSRPQPPRDWLWHSVSDEGKRMLEDSYRYLRM
jgi:hypothetical protein